MDEIIGYLSSTWRLKGSLSPVTSSMAGSLSEPEQITGDISIPEVILPDYYEGDYNVTPHFSEQVLETEDKVMRDDVTILEIPVVRTSNPYGGDTIVIG